MALRLAAPGLIAVQKEVCAVIVIFEGPDGAGKSTMIEAVKDVHLSEGHAPESVQV